jgi:hypothetical protein
VDGKLSGHSGQLHRCHWNFRCTFCQAVDWHLLIPVTASFDACSLRLLYRKRLLNIERIIAGFRIFFAQPLRLPGLARGIVWTTERSVGLRQGVSSLQIART